MSCHGCSRQRSELALTTDPDRILELAGPFGSGSSRDSVRAARLGRPREEVVVALAREVDRLQRDDRLRLESYEQAARGYLAAFRAAVPPEAPWTRRPRPAVRLAERLLPTTPE